MLTKLNKERIELVMEYCLERFGISHGNLDDYIWYIGSKNRIYIGPSELERIRPESIGLCIFRIGKSPKPTTNFIQLFGHLITKNVIEINERMNSMGEPICDVNLPDIDPPSHENQSAAIVFLNSYRNPIHEQKLLNHLLKSGWHHVSISTDLAQVIKVLPRAETTVVDAYHAPIMNRYLKVPGPAFESVSRHLGLPLSPFGVTWTPRGRPRTRKKSVWTLK